MRVNVDSTIVECFDSYNEFKKKFPDHNMGRKEFNRSKNFSMNNDMEVDIFEHQKPGPKVTQVKKNISSVHQFFR